jgi:hypothetical protein
MITKDFCTGCRLISFSHFVLFLSFERIMIAKGSSVQQRSTSDRMKISSLLNNEKLACPQNVLKLPQGPESVRFLAVNISASSVQEDGKFTPTIEAEEPSWASFWGRGRCVASRDKSAATSEDTWPASGRRRGATAIADDENPGARSKRMRGASEALEIERHLAVIPKLETTQFVIVTPPIRPRQKRRYTRAEMHFIWYYRVVLSEKWEDIHKSFNDNFTPRSDPSCLRDKLRQLITKGELPARSKKDQEQTHDREAGQAISHTNIDDVVKRCESLGYPWMKGASRTAGSQSVASQGKPTATSEDKWPASGRRRGATAIADDENPGARSKRMRGASEALEIERHLAVIPKLEMTQFVIVTPPIRPRQKRGFTEEEVYFIWYYRVVLSEKWDDIHKRFSHRFTPRENSNCLQDKLLRLTRKGELPACPKKDQEQIHDGEVRQTIFHATIEDVIKRCESLGYPWMKGASRTTGSSEVQDHSQ